MSFLMMTNYCLIFTGISITRMMFLSKFKIQKIQNDPVILISFLPKQHIVLSYRLYKRELNKNEVWVPPLLLSSTTGAGFNQTGNKAYLRQMYIFKKNFFSSVLSVIEINVSLCLHAFGISAQKYPCKRIPFFLYTTQILPS